MILPTKRLTPDRALLTLAAEILEKLKEPKTVSRLWDEMNTGREIPGSSLITFDWFVLALDLLFMLGTADIRYGRIVRLQS